MSAPRKSAAELKASGAWKNHPDRERVDLEDDAPLRDEPPEHMEKDQKSMWRELVKCVPDGVLSQADEGILEVTACLWAEFRHGGCDVMQVSRIAQLHKGFAVLGMTPVDRRKLAATPAPKGTGFEDV